jgi:hypothetical protein
MPSYRGHANHCLAVATCWSNVVIKSPCLSASQTPKVIFLSSKIVFLPHWPGWVWPKPPYAKLLVLGRGERKGNGHPVE